MQFQQYNSKLLSANASLWDVQYILHHMKGIRYVRLPLYRIDKFYTSVYHLSSKISKNIFQN